jgi:RNA polymerase sigma-70 factor (ECF subfamily)
MQAPTSTFDLLERIRHGDRQVFSPLFDKYRRRLAVLIHYRLGPELSAVAEVDDILQDVFLRAFQDIDKFSYESPGSFLRWLSRIADHAVIDLARYHGRQRRAATVLAFRSESNPDGPEPADSRTPSRVFMEREGLAALIEKLNALPEDYRQAILLAKVEGLTTAEMAEQLGRSRESAALLLHRALKRFRALEARRVNT